MLSTSFALSKAATDAMSDESIKEFAFAFQDNYQELDKDQFMEALFVFSANLTSVTAALVTEVFMTKDQINEMLAEANALRDLAQSIENE